MSRLDTIAMNDSGFAFDPMSGESYSLNDSAQEIVELLKAGREAKEIAQHLSDEYAISFEDAYRDTLEFVEHLKLYGLV